MPASRLMPVNVTFSEERIVAWFAAGAAAVGIGPGLITPAALAGRDDTGLLQRVQQAGRWVRAGGPR
ncbi:MAG: hypothetical protein ACXWNG_00965 [Candidatus Limnocylindrales bacterium]